jgi:sulfopyruvate decarboxylase TPP-binding subunit
MLDGSAVAAALKECGVTHVIWVPDTHLGTWEQALLAEPALRLVRVCREGEAIGIAGGLLLGGKKPIVLIQCTGFFEAGDALRNIVHDMKLPLFLIVGLRGHYAHQQGKTGDSCPLFSEPIVQAWKLPYVLFTQEQGSAELVAAYRQAQVEGRAGAILLAEAGG